MSNPELHVKGTISYIKHSSPDDTFHIMSLRKTDKEYITILGPLFGVKKGDEIEVWGKQENHSIYGAQIRVSRWEKPIPTDKEQIIAFLSSSLVKGVGKVTAKRIAEKIGDNALNDIIENGPEILHGIKGITKKNAKKIYNSLHETFEIQRIVMQLAKMGLSPALVIRAYQHYGSPVAEMVKQNPYCLTQVSLIGFPTADDIARNVGIPLDSPFRIKSAIKHVLDEAAAFEGHCFLTIEQTVERAMKLLNRGGKHVSYLQVNNLVGEDKNVVLDNGAVYLWRLYKAELQVAKKVKALLFESGMRVPGQKIDSEIRKFELANGITLARDQLKAVHQIFNNNLCILTGGPGTGKSTTINAIINVYQNIFPDTEIFLTAPTGKASRRMAEITGREAFTIHRLLGIKPGEGPEYNKENPFPADLIVIDEVSMVDISLARLLLSAINPKTKMLIVGDCDQLPSVGPGNILQSLIKAHIPVVHLTEIFRQSQQSQIVINAHRINKGFPIHVDHNKGDFFFLKKKNPVEIAKLIVAGYVRLLKRGYSVDDIQVLSPMKKGPIGVEELNQILQRVINPPSPTKPELKKGQTVFRTGDKVMQIKNNYDKNIFNGDVGLVTGVIDINDDQGNKDQGNKTGKKGLVVRFHGENVIYKNEELDQLTIAFCTTIHKAQGGEWPIIIMPVSMSHYTMLARNIIYTGLTRAKKMAVFIGTDEALNAAIKNNQVTQRNTRLAERIMLENKAMFTGTEN